ncbi:cytochrome b561 [Aquimarina amphilecti]|uniref:Cytochrome b561 n=1 Tax=Aquimarina amphilecti TaxID=1038014 RepID=A0A1H7UQ44_AQUAM|nr:cytochrome b/b6 domain-containing protein [Aquimarina amphilecti]SEL99162.1 cytochrome b561 [Aquimarina amphilecti]
MQQPSITYSKRTIWIHWVSTVLIFGLIYTGINMEHQAVSERKFILYQIHFSLGILVFLLTIIRIIGLCKDRKPKNLYPKKSIRERVRKCVYYGFYISIIWMCVSGLASLFLEGIIHSVQSSNWQDLPEISVDGFHPIMLSHHIMAKMIFLLLLFHISGFVLHLIQKKENTLKRIWFN